MPAIITRGAASAKAFGWSSGGGTCSVTYGERFYAQCCNGYSAGTYSWVAPAGVFHVSVVAVGSGASQGGGGGLGYKNNYAVTPGGSYTVQTGGNPSNCSYFVSTAVVKGGSAVSGGAGGTYTGDGGGNGGTFASMRGGGAGGYAGNANSHTGGAAANAGCSSVGGGGGGGGVGLYGQGTSALACSGNGGSSIVIGNYLGNSCTQGTAGAAAYQCCSYYCCPPIPITTFVGGTPGFFGGGSGQGYTSSPPGGRGAVRIIYPGNARSFPSTNASQLGVPLVFITMGASASYIVPVGATKLKAEVISAQNGYTCGKANNGTCGTGGGGGAYAMTSCISVTAGNTIYYFAQAGGCTGGTKSWVNKIANSAPTSTTNGVSATSAQLTVGGSAATAIGTVTYSGGNGGAKSASGNNGGGGGGAANPCGAGANGGVGYSPTSAKGGGGGGGAGGSAAAVGNTGTCTAGGVGGAGGSVGTGGAGATATTSAVAGLNGGGGGGGFGTYAAHPGYLGGRTTIGTTPRGYVWGSFGGAGGSQLIGGAGGAGGTSAQPYSYSMVILTFS